jgi:hypothetical protein
VTLLWQGLVWVDFVRTGLVRVGIALALVAGGSAGGVAVAPAARAAACSGSTGVTVVVDFAALGGGIRVGCASGSPSSGLDALQAAGFRPGFVPGQFGFVCQINELPTSCNGAPPATEYWSYWHAKPGGSWTYSNEGAATFTPPSGSVEGWAFGAGKWPGIAPPARAAPPTTTSAPRPTTARPTTTRPTTAAPDSTSPAQPGPPAAAGSTPGTHRPANSARAGTHPRGTPSATASPATTVTATGTPSPGLSGTADGTGPPANAADQRPAGINPGLVVGLVLITTLVGLTLLTRWRRARDST